MLTTPPQYKVPDVDNTCTAQCKEPCAMLYSPLCICVYVFVCIDVLVCIAVCCCIAVFECLCLLLSSQLSRGKGVHCVPANKSSRQFSTHGRYFPPPLLFSYHLQTHFLLLQNAKVVFPGLKNEPTTSSNMSKPANCYKLLPDHKLPKKFARNLGINIHFLDLTNQRLRICLFQLGFYAIIQLYKLHCKENAVAQQAMLVQNYNPPTDPPTNQCRV